MDTNEIRNTALATARRAILAAHESLLVALCEMQDAGIGRTAIDLLMTASEATNTAALATLGRSARDPAEADEKQEIETDAGRTLREDMYTARAAIGTVLKLARLQPQSQHFTTRLCEMLDEIAQFEERLLATNSLLPEWDDRLTHGAVE